MDLDPPERINRFASSREELKEEVDAQMCPYGRAIESRTQIVEECEKCMEERDVIKQESKENRRM